MQDWIALIGFFLIFFVLGHVINSLAETLYWVFIDWKNRDSSEDDN